MVASFSTEDCTAVAPSVCSEITVDERTPLLPPHAHQTTTNDTTTTQKLAKEHDAKTPLKWGAISVLLLLNVARAVAFESVYPFVNEMVYEVGVVRSPEEVGFASGLIESLYAVASFVLVMPMTIWSDFCGRKPVILVGVLMIVLSTTLLGMSTTFAGMVLARCVAGTLGGVLSTIRTMLAEMTDKTNQDVAFSALAISLRFGQVVGQPLGGYLSHPERRWRTVFGSAFWKTYPFALPCLVVGAFGLFSIAIGYMHLKETLPSSRRKSLQKLKYKTQLAGKNAEGGAASSSPTLRSALTENVVALLINTFGMYFMLVALHVVYPLFAFTPIQSGGLSLSEAQIGVHLASRCFLTLIALFAFPAMHKKFGTLSAYRMAMWSGPFIGVMPPMLNLLARNGITDGILFNSVLAFGFGAWSIFGMTVAGSTLLANDVAPTAEAVATLVGINQMATVLPQALAPSLITSLFAYSIENEILGGNLVWVFLSLWSTAFAIHTWAIKDVKFDWREDYLGEEED